MKLRAWVYTWEQMLVALGDGRIEYVYVPMRLIDGAADIPRERIILLPPEYLADCEENVEKRLAELKNAGFTNALVHTVGHIELLQRGGFRIFGGSRLNCVNRETLKFLCEQGINDVILSVELTAGQLNSIADASRGECTVGFMAYGKLPLMLNRRCPIKDGRPCGTECCNKQITDRMGKKLDVICSENTVEILNSDTLALSDKLGDFRADHAVLRFTTESDVSAVIDAYAAGKSLPLRDITRGLYYRGVE